MSSMALSKKKIKKLTNGDYGFRAKFLYSCDEEFTKLNEIPTGYTHILSKFSTIVEEIKQEVAIQNVPREDEEAAKTTEKQAVERYIEITTH